MNPIKTFVVARAHSVVEQLAGKSEGYIATSRGPGGPGRPGGRPGIAGAGGPSGFGPGHMLASAMVAALDSNQNGELSEAEFTGGFARWYQTWTSNSSGSLSADQLRAGIGRDIAVRGRPDDFGPPPDDDR